jgi:hypothetical protein
MSATGRAQRLRRLGLGGLLLAAVILGEARFHWLRGWLGGGALAHRALAMEQLGRHLAQNYRGARAVVLSNPFSRLPGQPSELRQFEEAGLRGLRRGLGKSVVIEAVVFPPINPLFHSNRSAVYIDPQTTTPLSYLMTPDSLDRITAEHPQAELLVSLVGLPVNARETKAWNRENGPKFALLLPDLRLMGDANSVREAVMKGKVAAMILNKPGAPPEARPLGQDLQAEFDLRFLLVHRETLEDYLEQYPGLFR